MSKKSRKIGIGGRGTTLSGSLSFDAGRERSKNAAANAGKNVPGRP